MKKVSFIAVLFAIFSLCAQAETKIQVPGIFINSEGYILSPYQEIANNTEIKLNYKESEMIYTLAAFDALNNLAILKPKTPLATQPVPLLLDTPKVNDKVICQQFISYPSVAPVYKAVEGSVKSLTGVEGDIHHFQIESSKETPLKKGFVFNNNGVCLGFISNRQTDIYSLIQPSLTTSQIALAQKIESLYPLVKNLNGIRWTKTDATMNTEEISKIQKESLVSLDVTINAPAVENAADFYSLRSKIPANTLFIYVSVSSGFEQGGFGNLLMEALKGKKIGQTVDSDLKQKYYASIFEKYGQPNLSPEELVKMAADLSDGYYLDASCSIASGTAEDSVILKLYKMKSSEILAEIKTAEVLSLESSETLKKLTIDAVKNLAKELKAQKVNSLFAD